MKDTIHLLNGQFPISTPEQQGISSGHIATFLQEIERSNYDLHSLQIVRNGKLCFSSAASPYTLSSWHRMFSAAKAVIAATVLFAMDEGKLSLGDRVTDYFRDLIPESLIPQYERMTVYDLLTMQTGQTDDPFVELFTNPDADLTRLFFTKPVPQTPGVRFSYNNTVPHVLYCLVERATGVDIATYLRMHLCAPLGAPIMAQYNADGMYNPCTTVMSSDALLKIAVWFLQEGAWEGKQLLNPELIRSAGSLQVSTEFPAKGYSNSKGYGFQLWRNAYGGYRMDGGFGQFGIILPEEDMAVAIMSNERKAELVLDLFYDQIYSHMRKEPLPYDPTASTCLENALKRFTPRPFGCFPRKRQMARN